MKLLDMESFSYNNGNNNNNHNNNNNNDNNSSRSSTTTSNVTHKDDGDGDGDGDRAAVNVRTSNGQEVWAEKRLDGASKANGREWSSSWILAHQFRRSIGYCLHSSNASHGDSNPKYPPLHQHVNGTIPSCFDHQVDGKMKRIEPIKETKPKFSKQVSDVSKPCSHKVHDSMESRDRNKYERLPARDYRRTLSLPPIWLSHRSKARTRCEKDLSREQCSREQSSPHDSEQDRGGGKITARTSAARDSPPNEEGSNDATMVTSSWSEFITSHGIHDEDGDGDDGDDGDKLLDFVYGRDSLGFFDRRVDLSELFLGHKFASGAYSKLYLGRYKGLEVVVKILCKPDDDERVAARIERQFRCEISMLSRVEHPNVVKFVGAFKKPRVCCIMTEYVMRGSLRSYLQNRCRKQACDGGGGGGGDGVDDNNGNDDVDDGGDDGDAVVDMALDIAHGMEYLHSKGVIHRDLKSENLLISDSLRVKIADFGVACFAHDPMVKACSCAMPLPRSFTPDDQCIGTYRWMAPEMLCHRHFSKMADVYSFGIVLWELITGHVPFHYLTPVQAAFAVVHKHAMLSIPASCPEALSELMLQCWSRDPNQRPTFSEIVSVLQNHKHMIHKPLA